MRIITFLGVVLLALVVLSAPPFSSAQIGISVTFGPPPIPVYEQPICPGEGYIWTPGYWAWDPDIDDYYWVPGTWVLAPEVGFLWTPPWWGWRDGAYFFHEGYWGPHVGFYGGIAYGFGYFGSGYVGGRWDHDHFFYNRSVTNVNVVNIHNVYNETVVYNNTTINHVSYNGGPGGIEARPRPEEERAEHERHIGPAAVQGEHERGARSNPELRAAANHGRPPIAATARPGEFRGESVVAAREAGGSYHPPANRGNAKPRAEGGTRPWVHPNDLPPFQRPAPPNTGNPNRDRKYQQQQDKLYARQDQERQKLQQKQEQEHQRMERQNAPQQQRQQVEQRHQQQTQQLQQKHEQQQQHMQQKQRRR
jgi:YXWGXW repeat-containing protein